MGTNRTFVFLSHYSKSEIKAILSEQIEIFAQQHGDQILYDAKSEYDLCLGIERLGHGGGEFFQATMTDTPNGCLIEGAIERIMPQYKEKKETPLRKVLSTIGTALSFILLFLPIVIFSLYYEIIQTIVDTAKGRKRLRKKESRLKAFMSERLKAKNLTNDPNFNRSNQNIMAETLNVEASNFIEQYINEDLENGKMTAIQTRFPPEPNGYLHIGHVKSMLVNFGTALKYGGKCNLFFDDTNPSKEKTEFVNAIRKDIEWVGYHWAKEVYASDFFDIIYNYAEKLIEMGVAFVDDQTADEISATRGTLTEPGKESPYRNRSVEENLTLFREMKAGKYPDGSKCLRAKIDMASPNINLRDPVIYRILRATHHRTGDKWCIYPMYDYAHPICDYLQGVTHSLCTLEFEGHRPLYDWVGITLGFSPKPRQIEFARLNITNTVMSKRYLKKLVEQNLVHGWDDPRMPTVAGLRNRGIPPKALLDFCSAAGICKADSVCDSSYLEHFIRDNLNQNAERAMVVLDPLKLTITNFEGTENVEFTVNPMDENSAVRTMPFSKSVYIEKGDFSLDPPPKYNRLKLGGYVRLKGAYIVMCDDVVKDENGNVVEVLCHYIPESRSSNDTSGIKVKGTIHWVSADTAVDCTVKNYSYLLNDAEYDGQDFDERMNLNSEVIIENAKAEPYLSTVEDGKQFQLLRTAYYKKCTEDGKLCLSFIVSMKDSFKK